MTSVELGIIQDILGQISKQDKECLYAGIHFTHARKYVKLLSTEDWLPQIWPSSYGWWRETTIEEAISARYSYIDLWMVLRWNSGSRYEEFSYCKRMNIWPMPLHDNTYTHRYII